MTNAGWYPDPTDARVMRYWDGIEWKGERVLNVPASTTTAAPDVPDEPALQLSTVATLAERFPMTKTSWFLFSGVAVAALGVLMPWEHDTMALSSISRGPTASAGGAVLLFVLLGITAWVAWPSRTQALSKKRRVALSVLVGVLGFFVIAKFASLAHANAQAHAQAVKEDSGLFPGLGSATEVSYGPGFGLFMYAAGVVTMTIGLTQKWLVRMRDNFRGAIPR